MRGLDESALGWGRHQAANPHPFSGVEGYPSIMNAQSSHLHQIRLVVWFWTTITTHMADDACVSVVSRLWVGCNGLVEYVTSCPSATRHSSLKLLLWPDHIGRPPGLRREATLTKSKMIRHLSSE